MVNSQGVYEALKKLFVTDKDGHIIVDSIGTWGAVDITDDWTRQLGLVDLSRVLGAALAHTNPVIVRISDGTSAYLNPQTIRTLTSADVVTADSLSKWGGTTLTGRDITPDIKQLSDMEDVNKLMVIPAAKGKTTIYMGTATSNASATIKTVTAGKTFYLCHANLTVSGTAVYLNGSGFLEADTGGNASFAQLARYDIWTSTTATQGPVGSVPITPAVPVPFTAGTVFRVRSNQASVNASGTVIGWEE
jgi:hypothetical protein